MSDARPAMFSRYDDAEIRARFTSAEPFPHYVFDNFLDAEFARRVGEAFPTYEEARKIGREFRKSREKLKIGISDSSKFAPPVSELNEALAHPGFLAWLFDISGVEELRADSTLVGGGIHVTGPGGRLDVHVDFNYREDLKQFRRLNLLIYFNRGWQAEWGGQLELWDEDVKQCRVSVEPAFNRCVIFETSEFSFHGVRPISRAANALRHSFAAYYYADKPPKSWSGEFFDTHFRPRPNERLGFLRPFARWFDRSGAR